MTNHHSVINSNALPIKNAKQNLLKDELSHMSNKNNSDNNSQVPSVMKDIGGMNTDKFNDLIVSAKPANIVSTNKCGDSLTSSPSESSSSDEEQPTSQRNGSYDFVLAEENIKNEVMSSEVKFPTKKYDIISKNEVVKHSNTDTSYRENWKARNKAEQQNTMVFNFVNMKRGRDSY